MENNCSSIETLLPISTKKILDNKKNIDNLNIMKLQFDNAENKLIQKSLSKFKITSEIYFSTIFNIIMSETFGIEDIYSYILSYEYKTHSEIKIKITNKTKIKNLINNIESKLIDSINKSNEIIRSNTNLLISFKEIENIEEIFINGIDFCFKVIDSSIVEIIYDKSKYSEYRIKNLLGHIKNIINVMSSNIHPLVKSVSLITKSEKKTIQLYNNTNKLHHINSFVHNFYEQVEMSPTNLAIKHQSSYITYIDLDHKSNQIAHYLISRNIKKNNCIGVIASKDINTIINILGILKAGCIYVPIEPNYPEDRKNFIKDDCNCKLVLNSEDIDKKVVKDNPTYRTYPNIDLTDIAYIIYTSGSTGNPKGVSISHGSFMNTIIDINDRFLISSKDKILGLSSFSFDLSIYDIFGSLVKGATLILVDSIKKIKTIKKIIKKEEITIWNSVPASMDLLTSIFEISDEEKNNSLRLALLSGDWIPLQLPESIKRNFPNCQVVSLGGATEASIWSIYHIIDKVNCDWKSIPYGKPLTNQTFYVLNEFLIDKPIGSKGELYIGGSGLAKCYHNNPILSQNSFIEHMEYGRLYRTGDYGILHSNGCIEFLGRIDNQIKINGFRIELGEIESHLNAIVEQSIAISSKINNQNILIVYYKSKEKMDDIIFKSYLKNKLPKYMIPEHYLHLDTMPLTSNGKIDRKHLKQNFNNELLR